MFKWLLENQEIIANNQNLLISKFVAATLVVLEFPT